MRLSRLSLSVCCFFAGLLAAACTPPGQTSECPDGADGCACNANGTCDDGFTCVDDVCEAISGDCGNGVIDDGEECDQGGNNDNAGACKLDCTEQTCGDGYVGPGEACDDGNDVDSDECSNTCGSSNCGDGVVNQDEECDDGNDDDTDGCLSSCLEATCGDGFVQEGVEECDDGNESEDDACSNTCEQLPVCGDGLFEPGELCFEEETVPGDETLRRVALIDMNGDGRDDVTFASGPAMPIPPPDGELSVSVRTDDGFAARQFMEIAPDPTHLVGGDLNGDGVGDAVVGFGHSAAFQRVHGTEAVLDTLGPSDLSPSLDQRVENLAVGDLNDDGYDEVVVITHWEPLQPDSLIFVAVGGEEFDPPDNVTCNPLTANDKATKGPAIVDIAALSQPRTAIYYDDDQFPSVIFYDFQNGGQDCLTQTELAILLDKDLEIRSMFAADLDGDDTDELILATQTDVQIWTVLADAVELDRTLTFPGDEAPALVQFADVNGDGELDLLGRQDDDLVIYFAPEYSEQVIFEGGNQLLSYAIGDINDDGYADIAVVNGTEDNISVYVSNP